MNDDPTLHAWIDHVFDHPVSSEEWYWSENARKWPGPPDQIPALIAQTFERSGELLSRFSSEQLGQGLWFLIGDTPPVYMLTLVDENVPLATRLRALRSFVPLFEQIMAVRRSARLSHLDKKGGKPLDRVCYMWWDLLWYHWMFPIEDRRPEAACAPFYGEILLTLRRLLTIPHDACRESALHGIGHWVRSYPELADTVDEFLSVTSGVRPKLIEYANRARAGQVQ
jgi:hypothetical protein